jgi:NADH:ubiquinone oxidoreductase subunit 5 (subunit L)/multisubunit Na+/H+ antiporter MnhA subunit
VVAGVWLLMKFRVLLHHRFHVIVNARGVIVATRGIGLVTLFIRSIIATRELDVKKIIALSTLRQVGFMFLISGLNLLSMSYLHLLSHAFYKSCIFIFIGITLLTRFHQQDKRYQNDATAGVVTILGLILTLARLSGLAFTSGIVSKECVVNIASMTALSIVMEFGVYIGRVLTIIYCINILLAMNSITIRLRPQCIASLTASGLVMRRLVFRSMTITNVVLLPIVSFRVETIIPSGFISSTAFIKLVYYRPPNEPMPRINATFTIDNIVFFESIGVIDQTLILIEATLYCQE